MVRPTLSSIGALESKSWIFDLLLLLKLKAGCCVGFYMVYARQNGQTIKGCSQRPVFLLQVRGDPFKHMFHAAALAMALLFFCYCTYLFQREGKNLKIC